jgi:hypothetical protein
MDATGVRISGSLYLMTFFPILGVYASDDGLNISVGLDFFRTFWRLLGRDASAIVTDFLVVPPATIVVAASSLWLRRLDGFFSSFEGFSFSTACATSLLSLVAVGGLFFGFAALSPLLDAPRFDPSLTSTTVFGLDFLAAVDDLFIASRDGNSNFRSL